MTQLYERLASRVREERELANLSQSELAERSGLSRSQLANIENGRQRPPIEAIYKLSLGLQVSVDSLLPAIDDLDIGRSARVAFEGHEVTPKAATFLRGLDSQQG